MKHDRPCLPAITSLLFFLIFPGCAFHMNLIPPETPLKEKVVEGRGTAKIVILDVSGFISERKKSDRLGLTQQPSLVERVKEALTKAEGDEDVVGLIVKVNSPGGLATASDIIYHEIVRFKERKGIPVYACIMGIGTSGGYYIASAAEEIIAHPTAITGSIGVITLKFNIAGLMDKIGVEEETVKSGDKKDIFSPFRPLTEEEREIVQEIIDSLYGRFLEAVHAQRQEHFTMDELRALADGRIYSAVQAAEARLVDRIGYLDDAIQSMKESLAIKDARIITYSRAGEYKSSIYSAYPAEDRGIMELLSMSPDEFSPLSGVEFLYLWLP